MTGFQRYYVVRFIGLLSVFGLIGLGLALSSATPVSVARAPTNPAANTVNHFYNDVDASGGYNILDNQSAEKSVFTSFSFADTTFYSPYGALTYTVAGKPVWLTWYAVGRTFYGTPPAGALASYVITVTADDGVSTDWLTFTLKVANVADSGQSVPVFTGGDPSTEFFIRDEATYGMHLYPDLPVSATDGNNNLSGYRFVAPVGITIPFSLTADGTVFATSTMPPDGKYYYTIEAYDSTGYQDTAHLIINLTPNQTVWGGATNSDWHTLSNWTVDSSPNLPPDVPVVPSLRTFVVIPTGTANPPTINTPAFGRNLYLHQGVTMNADLTIAGDVQLFSNLNTGAATLIMSGTHPVNIVNVNGSEVIGNVRRTELVTNTAYNFGHVNTQLTFYGATAPAAAMVTLVAAPPAGNWVCALSRYYTVSVPGWVPGIADLRLHYALSDGTCNPLKLYRAPTGTTNWTEVPGAVSGGASPDLFLAVTGQTAVAGYDFALGNLCNSTITVTNNADNGAGSLRQAIADVCAGGTITFASDYTITLTSPLTLTYDLTIDGETHHIAVSGDHAVRVFDVAANSHVALQNLTIARGEIYEGNGGGILNQGVLTVTNCLLDDNLAWPAPYSGGGLYNSAASQLTVMSSTFTNNGAAGAGAGLYNAGLAQIFSSTFSNGASGYASSSGAGIANLGVLTVTSSLFSNNSAPQGAGLSNGDPNSRLTVFGSTFISNTGTGGVGMDNYGTAEVYDSTFADNQSDGGLGPNGGGGIYNYATLTVTHSLFFANFAYPGGGLHNDGNLTVLDSIFSGNMARYGGGIYNTGALTLTRSTLVTNTITTGAGGGVHNSGLLLMTNSTLSGNTAFLGNGGGLYNLGVLTATHNTLSGNSAATTPPALGGEGGGLYNQSSTLALYNTLIANSPSGGDCVNTGILSANIHNLIEDGSCTALLSGDPRLAPLNSFGVHALLSDSVAIDAGDAASCLPIDQRGESRDDLRCDIGAYELKYPDSPTIIRSVSSTTTTTFGPALIGLQRNAAVDPGVITVTKSLTWQTKPDNAIDAYWSITPTMDTGLNLTLTLCYTPTENNGLTLDALRFWKFSAGAWTPVPGMPVTSTVGPNMCATLARINELSVWTLATDTPTTVTLQDLMVRSNAATTLPWLALIAAAGGGIVIWCRRRVRVTPT